MVRVWLGCFCALMVGAMSAARADRPPIEAYGAVPAASHLSLSPSGKRAAFLLNTTDKGLLIAVQDVGGKIIITANAGGAKLDGLTWAGEDYLLIHTSATVNLGMDWGFKHELGGVVVLDLRTMKALSVFHNTAKIADAVFGSFGVAQIGGRWYGFFGGLGLAGDIGDTYLADGHPQLYKVDLQTGRAELVGPNGEHELNWVVGPDGAVIAHSDYDEKKGDWRLILGAGTGGAVVLSRNAPLGQIGLLGQGRSRGTVLVQDSTGAEDVLEEVSLKDGKTVRLLDDNTIRAFVFDQVSGLLLGAEVRDPGGAAMFDAGLQAKVRATFKAFPGHHVELVDFGPALDEMIVFTDGADDSGTYWFVDIPKGSAIPLGGARPNVPDAEVGVTRMFAYKAADGLELEGVLTLPPGGAAKGLPIVVMPHGGPIGIRDDVGFDWMAQAYASRGYAVFQPNYRGSGGYGQAFRKAGYGEWGRKMLSDISDGLTALAAQGVIDPHRACIVGASYGGYAALAGVTLQQGLYRCAVSYAGVSDLPDLRAWDLDRQGADGEIARYWRTAISGDTKDAPSLGRISPARMAAKADAPILLMHGKDDTVVPIEQSRKMAAALRAAGKPVELIEFAGQDHWLSEESSRIQMLKAAVDFVLAHDPPH